MALLRTGKIVYKGYAKCYDKIKYPIVLLIWRTELCVVADKGYVW